MSQLTLYNAGNGAQPLPGEIVVALRTPINSKLRRSGIVADVAPPERADFPAGELQRCRAAGAETSREENSSFAGTAQRAVPAKDRKSVV